MTKRPTLENLSNRLSGKSDRGLSPSAEKKVSQSPPKKRGAQPDGRKGVLLRLKPEAWLQLKSLAASQTLERDEVFSMQSALEEALNDYFRKYGKPPIA